MKELLVVDQREVLGKEFKMYGDFENPLFLAKDVAEWIEHSNPRMMLKSVDEDEKVVNNAYTLGGNQEQWFLTEDGLYEVLMQSRKPIAKQFKKQVKTILKELRKGNVELTPTLTKKQQLQLAILNGDELERVSSLKMYEELVVQEATQPLIEKIEEDKPLVTFADRVLKDGDNILVRELAKISTDEGYKIGEKRLYNKLREWGWIFKHSTEPTQKALEGEIFIVETRVIKTPYGDKQTFTTKVTPKGQIKIIEKLLSEK